MQHLRCIPPKVNANTISHLKADRVTITYACYVTEKLNLAMQPYRNKTARPCQPGYRVSIIKPPYTSKDAGAVPSAVSGSVLVIEAAQPLGPFLTQAPGAVMVVAPFEALDAELLSRTHPDCVVTPLFTTAFDVLDVAEKLVELGYAGRFLAVSQPLPNPRLIKSEVRAIGPNLTFDILQLPEGP